MAYTQDGYTLHKTEVQLKNGRKQTIYFFAKSKPKSGTPCDIPENKVVSINKRTGLPLLKNK